ncbi:hypothetical protein DSO57_1030046 [Entomophthora muscae]|uniref:Uncharacterized protein n=1 Tax=Entomophthora muscae TaxID=34485 RepID=A0ACC2UAH4_9FUNG|nr:hypothetical protein DSO57_1030046 [Entomophthora muscae]
MEQPLADPPENDGVDQLTLKISQTTVGDTTEDLKSMEISDKSKISEVVDLTKEVWEKIKSSSNINHVKLKPTGLFPNNAKTRAVLKEVLNSMASVELSYNISNQSMKNLWALGFRFTVLQLNLSTLNPDNQIKVLKTINPGICDLRLVLSESNQKILDTLGSCFESLKVLTITYVEYNKSITPFISNCSLEAMKITFKGQCDPVRVKSSKPANNLNTIIFNGVEFGPGVENHITSYYTRLIFLNNKVSKSILDEHFENVVAIGFHILQGNWDNWAIARDLKKLQGVTLDLLDENYCYSTSGFKYPQVVSLIINNLIKVDTSFFHWIAKGFPNLTILKLNSSRLISDLPNEKFSFQFGLPKLQSLDSNVKLDPEIYMEFLKLSPVIQEFTIPAGQYTVQEGDGQTDRSFIRSDSF